MPSQELLFVEAEDVSSVPNFLQRQNRVLKLHNHEYNPFVKLLKVSFSPRYGNPILKFLFKYYKVHATRESLRYALYLLETGDQKMILRAKKIVQRILLLQNTNPKSPRCGIWPKYWEEHLSRLSKPDLNWADFLGADLLLIALQYQQHFQTAFLKQIEQAIILAAQAIQRRNVDVNYTNIAIRGVYVTLIAAETYQIADLQDYALMRLEEIHRNTLQQGMFTEYNSPVYGVTTLKLLGRFRLDVKHSLAKVWVEDLYRIAWENFAHYFHPPTRQWAGPHSRNYRTLLEPSVLALIKLGTEGRINLGVSENILLESQLGIPIPCPHDLEYFFMEINTPRTLTHTVMHADPQCQLTTYITPNFTLGSASYSDLWHQRRALVAYWGSPKMPGFLRLRFLADGDDFAPAQFASIQKEGRVLAGVTFATNLDKHNPYAKPKTGRALVVKDLRLRFDIVGTITALKQSASEPSLLECNIEGVWVQLQIVFAQFGSLQGKWEVSQERSRTCLDWVFWTGQRQHINWSMLELAGMGMGIGLSSEKQSISSIQTSVKHGRLTLKGWDQLLSLKITPQHHHVLHQSIKSEYSIPHLH